MKKGTAYFIRKPRTQFDLIVPHLSEQEQPYEVVKKIILNAIDYENFSLDLLADRQFIENNVDLCSEGDIWRCLLICRRGKNYGILVVPEMTAYVKWAAYISEVAKES